MKSKNMYKKNEEWALSEKIGTLEEILSHFELPHSMQLFYNRDAELATLKAFLNSKATQDDKDWILNKISK